MSIYGAQPYINDHCLGGIVYMAIRFSDLAILISSKTKKEKR